VKQTSKLGYNPITSSVSKIALQKEIFSSGGGALVHTLDDARGARGGGVRFSAGAARTSIWDFWVHPAAYLQKKSSKPTYKGLI
jgi:hypothetical protein